jgi:hypothetical protein
MVCLSDHRLTDLLEPRRYIMNVHVHQKERRLCASSAMLRQYCMTYWIPPFHCIKRRQSCSPGRQFASCGQPTASTQPHILLSGLRCPAGGFCSPPARKIIDGHDAGSLGGNGPGLLGLNARQQRHPRAIHFSRVREEWRGDFNGRFSRWPLRREDNRAANTLPD